jgi:hypothetical protein
VSRPVRWLQLQQMIRILAARTPDSHIDITFSRQQLRTFYYCINTVFPPGKLGAPQIYLVKKGCGNVHTVLSVLITAMALCVYAKQCVQAQVEAVHNLSIVYDIYELATAVRKCTTFSLANAHLSCVDIRLFLCVF